MTIRRALVGSLAVVAAALIAPPVAAGPAAVVLETSDATVYEGDGGVTLADFEVRRIGAFTGKSITVTWQTADGTALAGQDYSQASGSLTFDKKRAVHHVLVSVSGDLAMEPDEHFFVRLSASGGGDGEGRGTILNDDGWPVDGG